MNKVLIFKNTFRLNLQKKTTRIAFGILGYEKLNLVIQSKFSQTAIYKFCLICSKGTHISTLKFVTLLIELDIFPIYSRCRKKYHFLPYRKNWY